MLPNGCFTVMFILWLLIPYSAAQALEDKSSVEIKGLIIESYEKNGRTIESYKELERILSRTKDVQINDSIHNANILTRLAIPSAFGGFALMGWSIGRVISGYSFDPYLFGSGLGVVGISGIMFYRAQSNLDSAVIRYNILMANKSSAYLELVPAGIALGASMSF